MPIVRVMVGTDCRGGVNHGMPANVFICGDFGFPETINNLQLDNFQGLLALACKCRSFIQSTKANPIS